MLVTSQESESAKYLTRGMRLLSVWNISAQPLAWSLCSARHSDSDTHTGEYQKLFTLEVLSTFQFLIVLEYFDNYIFQFILKEF